MLNSIQSQTYKDFYAIIYDNGSTDNTSDVIKPYLLDKRFSYYRENTNIGGEITNVIIDKCQTEYLLIVHDDDIMLPEMAKKQIQIFESNENVSIVSTNINYIDNNGYIIKKNLMNDFIRNNDIIIKYKEYIKYYIKNKNIIAFPTVMYRMTVLRTNKIFIRSDVGSAADTFLWLELNLLSYNFYYISESLYNYRVHDQQDSNNLFIMIPLLKKPVYYLLCNNEYTNDIILLWLRFVNKYIIRIYSLGDMSDYYYNLYKNEYFLKDKPEITFSIGLFFAIYFKKIKQIKIIKIILNILKCLLPYGLVRLYQKYIYN